MLGREVMAISFQTSSMVLGFWRSEKEGDEAGEKVDGVEEEE